MGHLFLMVGQGSFGSKHLKLVYYHYRMFKTGIPGTKNLVLDVPSSIDPIKGPYFCLVVPIIYSLHNSTGFASV